MSIADWTARAIEWSNEHPPPPGAPVGSRVPRSSREHEEWARWTRDLHSAGLGVMHWPKQWGGEEATPGETRAVARVLAQAGAPLPLGDIGITLVGPSIMTFGTPQQQAEHLPRIAEGSSVWSQLFSEPEAGSDLASLTTTAVLDGDEWIVNGEKIWNTYAHIAGWGYLLARTGGPGTRHRGLTMFLVRMDTPGITTRPIRKLMGSADFAAVSLVDVRLPADSVLGDVDQGWAVTMATLSEERRVVGRFVVGLESELVRILGALAAVDASETLRSDVAALVTETSGLLRLLDVGGDLPGVDSLSKIAYSDLNQRLHQVALELVATHPRAVTDAWIARWSDNYRNSPSYTIAGGANEVLRNVVAKRVLGMGGGTPPAALPGPIPGPGWVSAGITGVVLDTHPAADDALEGRLWGDPSGRLLVLLADGTAATVDAGAAIIANDPLDALHTNRARVGIAALRPEPAGDFPARVAFALAAEAMGAAAEATHRSLEYVESRIQFGNSLGSLQAIQHRVVDMHLATVLGAVLVEEAAAAWELGDGAAPSWRAKLFAGLHSAWVVEQAIQLHGAIGLTEDYGLQHPLAAAQRARLLLGGTTAAAREVLGAPFSTVVSGLHDWSSVTYSGAVGLSAGGWTSDLDAD